MSQFSGREWGMRRRVKLGGGVEWDGMHWELEGAVRHPKEVARE